MKYYNLFDPNIVKSVDIVSENMITTALGLQPVLVKETIDFSGHFWLLNLH